MVDLAFRRADDARDFRFDLAGRRGFDHRDALLEDAPRLSHLGHANEIAVVRVAVLSDRNLELQLGIAFVRLRAAQVPLHSATSQRRAGDAPVDGLFGRDHADADRAALPDAIVGQESFVLVDGGVEFADECFEIVEPAGRQIVGHTADAHAVERQARAAVRLEEIEYLFALAEAVEERRHRADVYRVRRQPQQMR